MVTKTTLWRSRAALLLACGLALASSAQAARLALVVGNASYTERPLKNPVNDATDLKKALEGAGFQVTLVLEANADKMKEAIAEFGDRLARENDVGLFYFSGHGVQTPKGNYLLPVGRSFQRERDVELFAVEARAVLDQMARARNPLNIVILDACRDSPLPATERSAGSKGLARMDAPSGSVIAFATAPGRTASDNISGRNGLYTKHLINALSTEGLTLEAVFRRVGAAVERDNPEQSPEEVMKLRSEAPFYFRPPRSTSIVVGNGLGQTQAEALTISIGSFTVGQVIKDCAGCPEIVAIPAGQFLMGSPKDEPDRRESEGPQHKVIIKRFYAGRYEVTFDEWSKCVDDGGCNINPNDDGWGRGARPVINVSWNDIQKYLNWISEKTKKHYRLLSESEWEYVARAGTLSPFWTGSTITSEQANFDGSFTYNGSTKGGFLGKTLPRGSFKPNQFGLYDTAGNVWEWVQDFWHEDYIGAPSDSRAWTEGGHSARRVLRGGSWVYFPRALRSADRIWLSPDHRSNVVGFRIARDE